MILLTMCADFAYFISKVIFNLFISLIIIHEVRYRGWLDLSSIGIDFNITLLPILLVMVAYFLCAFAFGKLFDLLIFLYQSVFGGYGICGLIESVVMYKLGSAKILRIPDSGINDEMGAVNNLIKFILDQDYNYKSIKYFDKTKIMKFFILANEFIEKERWSEALENINLIQKKYGITEWVYQRKKECFLSLKDYDELHKLNNSLPSSMRSLYGKYGVNEFRVIKLLSQSSKSIQERRDALCEASNLCLLDGEDLSEYVQVCSKFLDPRTVFNYVEECYLNYHNYETGILYLDQIEQNCLESVAVNMKIKSDSDLVIKYILLIKLKDYHKIDSVINSISNLILKSFIELHFSYAIENKENDMNTLLHNVWKSSI